MEKRLPLAILLSLLFAWVYLNLTQTPPQDGGTDGRDGSGRPTGTADGAPDRFDPGRTDGMGLTDGGAAPSLGAAQPPEQRADSITTPLPGGNGYHATFESWGAGLHALTLDGYTVTPDGDDSLPLLGSVDPRIPSFTLALSRDEHGLATRNWDMAPVTRSDGRSALRFTTEADGLRYTRTVTAGEQPYLFELEVDVENIGDRSGGTLALLLRGPQGVADVDYASFASTPPTAVALVSDGSESNLVKWSKGDLEDRKPRALSDKETLVAAGVMTNYFASVVAPRPGTFIDRVYPMPVLDQIKLEQDVEEQLPVDEAARERLRVTLADDHVTNAAVQLQIVQPRPAPGQSLSYGFDIFAGPKDRGLARQAPYAPYLMPLIEDSYGSMAWINRSLLAILEFWHGLTGNWGVAIILLTVLIKGLLFPLSRMQQGSMAKYAAVMQKLKPELDALKEKHKNNKQKFNQEQMRLMREYGATPPLGGCLLMIPQMFIWISLFQVLRASIELRQADFAFWITDLSRPDAMPLGLFGLETLNLLPILMAAAMFLQMKYTPQAASADPQQQQMQKTMAMLMPVMMLFFLYSYPAGLALYIFVSSLLGIFEYRVIRRYFPPPTADTIVLKKRPVPVPAGKGGKGTKGAKGKPRR